jgi:hypothetical protein
MMISDSVEIMFERLLTEAAVAADESIGRGIKKPTEKIIFSSEHERKMELLRRAGCIALIWHKIRGKL